MALPSVLSPPDLAKFRTKLCERLLATGQCHYGERCQYSHDAAWPRRNPEKVRYLPQRCGDASCARGRWCGMAHSEEEVLYHPEVYKETTCPGGAQCLGFYCPFSHGDADRPLENIRPEPSVSAPPGLERSISSERLLVDGRPPELRTPTGSGESTALGVALRRRAPRHRAGRRHTRQKDYLHLAPAPSTQQGAHGPHSPDTPDSEASEADAPLWDASDRLRVAADVEEAGGPDPGREAGASLLGGRLRVGWLRRGSAQEPSFLKCTVKLVPVSKDDRGAANTALAEVQRWAESDRKCARLFMVRKTKATICLALPQQPSTLDRSVANMGGGLAQHIEGNWRLSLLAARWVRELMTEADRVHQVLGAGHCCIAPRTVFVTQDGRLLLGDFLGKATVFHGLETAQEWNRRLPFGAVDPWWAMWYPEEVASLQFGQDGVEAVDQQRVDAWQLGVTVFYLFTGEHLFGDCRNDPEGVCRNISQGRPANLQLLARLPVFADLVLRTTARKPEQRPLPEALLQSHPAFWSLEDTAAFAALPATFLANAGRSLDDPWLPALQSAVAHLPWVAALGGEEPPASTPPPTVIRVVEVLAVAGSAGGAAWPKHEAELQWHFDRLHSPTEDLAQYYEEAAAWERWGRTPETPPLAAEAPPPAAEGEGVLFMEGDGGVAQQMAAAFEEEGMAQQMATAFAEEGWGPSPALCAAFVGAGFEPLPGLDTEFAAGHAASPFEHAAAAAAAAANAVAAANAAAASAASCLLGEAVLAEFGAGGPTPALDPVPSRTGPVARKADLSPVHVKPINFDHFKENVTPNRAAAASLSRSPGKGAAGLLSSVSPAYILLHDEVQGKDFPPDFDFSQEGIEAMMDVKALPPLAFFAILELRRRRLNSSVRGLASDLRHLGRAA